MAHPSEEEAPDEEVGDSAILSAAWTNKIFDSVLDDVVQLIDRLLGSIYAPGYGPLEMPVVKADVLNMTVDSFKRLLDEQPTIGTKAELLEILNEKGVDPNVLREGR